MNIHSSLQREIPEFLFDSVVYCDNLTFRKDEKSCFILTKNLKFYEFRKKQLQNCIDLNGTCLSSIVQQKISTFNGRKFGKWYGVLDFEGTDNALENSAEERLNVVTIGKYIYRNFEINELYLLLLCWNKLVVLKRCLLRGLQLIAEYENVVSFKIIPTKTLKYQAIVKIQFENESNICTNFQNFENADESNTNNAPFVQQKSEFKHLLDCVLTTKVELQLHKEITSKQFQRLYSTQIFGDNFVRSTNLEEKPMLARCGDVWFRITENDKIAVGLPLVNNCIPPNITLLKNLQPILNINDDTSVLPTKESSNNLHYEHRIYQLRQTFENLESLETVFQTEDVQLQQKTWTPISDKEKTILPNSFFVFIISMKLSQLVSIQNKCAFFIRYDVEKDLQLAEPGTHIFQQHLFIKALDFQEILHQRIQYTISFQDNHLTLHQDFLAIAMTSYAINLRIVFSTLNDLEKFEDLLAKKFDFVIVHRAGNDLENIQHHSKYDATLEMDDICDDGTSNRSCILFYNRKPNSLFYATLVSSTLNVATNEKNLCTDWTFYVKDEDKGFLLIKLLTDELISIKCNIEEMKFENFQHNSPCTLAIFENSIRNELKQFSEFSEDRDKNSKNILKLLEHQFSTDTLATYLLKYKSVTK